jgi:hypothetical protein
VAGQSVQGPGWDKINGSAVDSTEQRPQPSAEKVQLCVDMTAGRAVNFFGTPQSANQGDVYGLDYAYREASAGTADAY